MDKTQDDQPVFGLFILDGMPAGQHHAGFAGFLGAAAQDFGADLSRQIGRQGGDIQRQERPPAHGVDIREGIGGGDGAIIVRIVHHRGEEIGGDDQGALRIQTPDRRVVRLTQTHQQVRVIAGRENALQRAQHLRQRLRV